MANFDEAFKLTLHFEGKYVNDPADLGGETYCGISRIFHPNWIGWTDVDTSKKKNNNFPKCLDFIKSLNSSVKNFYYYNFWNSFLGDKLSNQKLANKLFDISVNMGVNRAVKFLQTSLNTLNKNEELYSDLVEDGFFGSLTFKTIELFYDKSRYPDNLVKAITILQGYRYLNNARKSPIQERFMDGWINRLNLEVN